MEQKKLYDVLARVIFFLILALILFAVILLFPSRHWKAFQSSDLYSVFCERYNYYGDEDLTVGKPYVIIRADVVSKKNGLSIDESSQKWSVVGCSNGLITKGTLDKVKYIIVCESDYKSAFYGTKGSRSGSRGYSEQINIYCIDVENGSYVAPDRHILLDTIRAKELPSNSSEVPKYQYSNAYIRRYVRRNLSTW